MKAPNKIYLQRNTTTDLYDEFWPEWFEGTHHPERDICYIRKDAMLGWAKTKLSNLQEDFDVYTGQRLILRELIEKIKSL